MEMVAETSVIFNQLTRLSAPRDFINVTRHISSMSYRGLCFQSLSQPVLMWVFRTCKSVELYVYACFLLRGGFLHGLVFHPEDGGDVFLGKITVDFQRTA